MNGPSYTADKGASIFSEKLHYYGERKIENKARDVFKSGYHRST